MKIFTLFVAISIFLFSELSGQTYCSSKVLTSASGTFTDGSGANNYANLQNCFWTIAPHCATSVTLSFNSVITEPYQDVIRVYDGINTAAPLIGEYHSDSYIPEFITSSNGVMFIQFITNESNTTAGWSASYTSSSEGAYCIGTTELTDATGEFGDGSGIYNFGKNSDCSWLIQPSGASSVTLSFPLFQVGGGGGSVYIYDGTSKSDPLLARISGKVIPTAVTSSGGSMLVHFTSDNYGCDLGWWAFYTSSPGNEQHCNGTTVLSEPSGEFDDGSGGSNYTKYTDCSWLIEPPGAEGIQLTFSSFSTQSNTDIVRVYDGSSNSARLIGEFSGNSIPDPVRSTGGSLFVHFITNGSFEEAGWSASYNSSSGGVQYCIGTTILDEYSGTFDDGSGENNYGNNSDCKYIISPFGTNSISLSFSTFDLEDGYDYIDVYKGASVQDPLLIGSYSGSTIPPVISTDYGSMLIHFRSDGFEGSSGWTASYTSEEPNCSGIIVLSESTGSFSDGSGMENYDPQRNCSWLIQPAGAAVVQLTFSEFDTESDVDFVRVYDGDSESAPLLGEFSGSSTPDQITSSGGSLFVNFFSDAFNTRSGWNASYISENGGSTCNGFTTLTKSSGTFSDGSGSNNYGNNSSCQWLIQPAVGSKNITLTFTSFDTELGNDIVNIYDGANTTRPLLGSYSGTTFPISITSSYGSLLVEFITDGFGNAPGWSASYTSIDLYCHGTTTLTEGEGVITDGSGANDYYNNSSCEWLIQPNGTSSITLSFTSFDTESGHDIVWVYDGTTTLSEFLGSFSGSSLPSSLTAYSGSMLISFMTNSTTTAPGWSAIYKSTSDGTRFCNGTTTLTGLSGSFTDGSGNEDYDINSDCSWLIQPTGANSVSLSFSSFDTEDFYDYVNIYDGATTSSTLLGSYSGSQIPNTITSSGGVILINFTSDIYVCAAGWSASYTSSITGVGDKDYNLQFEVYPNPNNGVFILELGISGSINSEIKIFNTMGRVIFDETIYLNQGVNKVPIKLNNSPPGIYHLQIRKPNSVLNKTFIIKQ